MVLLITLYGSLKRKSYHFRDIFVPIIDFRKENFL